MTYRKARALMYALVASILIGGLAVSFFFAGSQGFERSGALVVALTVAYSVYVRHRAILSENEIQQNDYSKLDARYIGKVPTSNAEVATSALEAVREIEFAKKSLLRHEAAFLITGTLIWGFGDLASKALTIDG